jgi:hypothetical protein
MKVKKWNGNVWVQDYPEVNVSSIVATGTPSSSTFLNGAGEWATPAGGAVTNNVAGSTFAGAYNAPGGGTNTGVILYGDYYGWHTRAIGTTGQVLTVSGGVPVWATPAAGTDTANFLFNNTTGFSNANNIFKGGMYSYYNGTNVPAGDFGLISIPTWTGTNTSNRYNLQIGANIQGSLKYRTTDVNGAGSFRTVWDETNLTNLNQLTNGPGYITSSGSISGNAATATNADTLDTYHETAFVRLAANSSSPTNGTFAIGTAASRNFIQSHSGQPLDINPLGNAVTIGGTSNTAWHAGNDGSGSGLDADTTDGLHIWNGTQAQYNAITTKDASTLYFIE